MTARWTDGNQVRLLENGEAYFPAVFDAIRGASREVIVETFILFEDKVGIALHAALLEAAGRGAQVDVLVDGYGSPELSARFIGALAEAGVRLRIFDPVTRVFGARINLLRRMHRKIVVVDGERAFVGGINYSADHLADFGPKAKQDYAVELCGPIVAEIRRFTREAIRAAAHVNRTGPPEAALAPPAARGTARALFVTRDNADHADDIERHYRIAIRAARQRVVIANADFCPGYRLLRELRRAARRGVAVKLILQGEPDMPIAKKAAELLYAPLLRAGVQIHEYCTRPLHAKVALVDAHWATVGSSNLDPLSLALNLEANVILRDADFTAHLAGRLQQLMDAECVQVVADAEPVRWWDAWMSFRNFVVFHFLRHYPTWAGWLPPHQPRIAIPTVPSATVADKAPREAARNESAAGR